MQQLKFGTDGWRAIIADDYTVANVARVATATARWLLKQEGQHSVVIGHDCRFGGEMFAAVTARVMGHHGIKVYLAKDFVSTPMVSLGTQRTGSRIGIVITASHNPPSYNGYKLKAHFGGPLLPEHIQEVEDLIPAEAAVPDNSLEALGSSGLLEYIDLEGMYIEHVEANFDLEAIRQSGIGFAYDAMYGSGQNVIRKLFPDAYLLHCDYNPSFFGVAPEPIHRNLGEFADLIKGNDKLDYGLATDGDADRIGLYDHEGNFIDAHHIILLLIHYLHQHKGMTGKVVTAFSVSVKIKKLCEQYDLPLEITKIGFKYICGHMVEEDVLLGGEESGGIAVKGHIPERDGIWNGLIILEYMAKSGKSLQELIREIYDIVGAFAYDRNDLHITEDQKQDILEKCKADHYQSFGAFPIQRVEKIDGFKYFLPDDAVAMIRPSGTEPVLRVYVEAPDRQKVGEGLEAARSTLLS